MKNLSIVSKNHEGVRGANYRSLTAKLDGKDVLSTLVGESIVDFTGKAIENAIGQAIRNNFQPIDLTVSASGLSEGAKVMLADMYSGDPLISSITFA